MIWFILAAVFSSATALQPFTPYECDETCYSYCQQYYPSSQCFLSCGCFSYTALLSQNTTAETNTTASDPAPQHTE